MQILFAHKNFPAQFGHVARELFRQHGIECAFVSEVEGPSTPGMKRVTYRPVGGATKSTHYCSRTFENFIAHSHGVFEALKRRSDIQPDLIVGHSGFGSTLFLKELYDCPIINYFEYFYHGSGSDMDFRPEYCPTEMDRLRIHGRNPCLLADLENCDAGYCPTEFQRSQLPDAYQHKLHTIFDGIDTSFWRPADNPRTGSVQICGREVAADTKIVTYVSRGFESMRGFDIFMNVAKQIAAERDDVVFVCVGSDRVCYGGDLKRTEKQSFREEVLASDDYPLDRFIFTGMLPPADLAKLFRQSDLHIYLTVPFVLSWSLMNALSSGCLVLGSDTAPVREVISHGDTGLLADFYDVDGFTQQALDALSEPKHHAPLRTAARRLIEQNYSIDVCLPQMLQLFESVAGNSTAAIKTQFTSEFSSVDY